MPFDVVHLARRRSKERFFDGENFLRLIDHYEILGWKFQGVDIFSHEGQLLTVDSPLPMVPDWPSHLPSDRARKAYSSRRLSTRIARNLPIDS
jgi:hypothetical protein